MKRYCWYCKNKIIWHAFVWDGVHISCGCQETPEEDEEYSGYEEYGEE